MRADVLPGAVVRPPAGHDGYALLAAVLVTALAAVFVAAAVVAAGAGLEVAASDAGVAVVSRAAGEALERACAGLRVRPGRLPCAVAGTAPAGGAAWSAACAEVPRTEATACVQADIVALAWSASARRSLHAVVELRPAQTPQGLAVGGDVCLRAPLTVSGGGLYSGGSVAGYEYVTFVDPLAGGSAPPADHVHGEEWPVAAVHALGGIWAQGVEIHDDPTTASGDTDMHTGAGRVEALTVPPSPEQTTLLVESADVLLEPGPEGSVDLSAVPAAPASGAGALVAVVPDRGTPVTVLGERAAAACPLVLLLEGDAALGEPGAPLRLHGAVIGLGSLVVGGPLDLEGHLWAATLSVDAPSRVATPVEWPRHPLPGLVDTVIVALGR